jgi:ATP-dependent RNA helicase DeaD
LPDDTESYTHRSGRTGRAGKTGISIGIVHVKEKGKIREIEKIINRKFEEGKIPTGDAICEKQLFHFVDRLEKVKVNEEEIARMLPGVYRRLEWLEKEDIIKRIVSLEMNRLIDYYEDASDIETLTVFRDDRGRDRDRSRGDRYDRNDRSGRLERGDRRNSPARTAEKGYARLFINIGKTDGINPATLMGFINDFVDSKVRIGRIDLLPNFSFFEVPERDATKVVGALHKSNYNGRKITVELSQPAKDDRSGGFSRSRKEDFSKDNSHGDFAKRRKPRKW